MATGFGVRLANYRYTGVAPIGTTAVAVPWDAEDDEDVGWFACNASGPGDHTIALVQPGRYLVWWWMRYEHTSGTNGRREISHWWTLSGSLLKPGSHTTFIRGSAAADQFGGSLGAGVLKTELPNELLMSWVQRTDASTASDASTYADRNGIALLKLDDAWECGRYELTSPGSMSTSWQSITWGTPIEETGSVIAQNLANPDEINLAEIGLYCITATVTVQSTSASQRYTVGIRATLDGAQINVPQAKTLRSADSCQSTALTLFFLMRTSSSGQVLRIEYAERTKNTGPPFPLSLTVQPYNTSLEVVQWPSDADCLMVRDLTGTMDADALEDIEWTTQDQDGGTSIQHSTTVTPYLWELLMDGRFLQLAQLYVDRTAGSVTTRQIHHAWPRKYSTGVDLKRGNDLVYDRGRASTFQHCGRAGLNVALSIASGVPGSQVGIRTDELVGTPDPASLWSTGIAQQVLNLTQALAVKPIGRGHGGSAGICTVTIEQSLTASGRTLGSAVGRAPLTRMRSVQGQTQAEADCILSVTRQRPVEGRSDVGATSSVDLTRQRLVQGSTECGARTHAPLVHVAQLVGRAIARAVEQAVPITRMLPLQARSHGASATSAAALALMQQIVARAHATAVCDQAAIIRQIAAQGLSEAHGEGRLALTLLSGLVTQGRTLGSAVGRAAAALSIGIQATTEAASRALAAAGVDIGLVARTTGESTMELALTMGGEVYLVGCTIGSSHGVAAAAVAQAAGGRALGSAGAQAAAAVSISMAGRVVAGDATALAAISTAAVIGLMGRTVGSAHVQTTLHLDLGLSAQGSGGSRSTASVARTRGLTGRALGRSHATVSPLTAAISIAGSTLATSTTRLALSFARLAGFYACTANKARTRFNLHCGTPFGLTVQHVNMPFAKPAGAYVRVQMVYEQTESMMVGPDHSVRAYGHLEALVYGASHEGSEAVVQMADAIADKFRHVDSSGLKYQEPIITDPRRVGSRWQLTVECPFRADDAAPRIDPGGTAVATIEDIEEAIRLKFRTAIELGQSVAVQYENLPFRKPDAAPYIRLFVRADVADARMRGVHGIEGHFAAQVLVPANEGERQALDLADAIDQSFRAANISGVRFDPPSVGRGQRMGDNWRVLVTCTWTSDL